MVKWIYAELDEWDHERQEEMIKVHSRCWAEGSWRSGEVGRFQFTRKGRGILYPTLLHRPRRSGCAVRRFRIIRPCDWYRPRGHVLQLKTARQGSWKRGFPYNSALLRHPSAIRFPHSSRRLDGNSSAVGLCVRSRLNYSTSFLSPVYTGRYFGLKGACCRYLWVLVVLRSWKCRS